MGRFALGNLFLVTVNTGLDKGRPESRRVSWVTTAILCVKNYES